MKELALTLLLSMTSLGASALEVEAASGFYFGQAPPGDMPVVFAPGVVSLEDRFEQFLLYSPDEKQLVYSVTNSSWSSFALESLRLENGSWTGRYLFFTRRTQWMATEDSDIYWVSAEIIDRLKETALAQRGLRDR